MARIRIGSRGSRLALVQTEAVKRAIGAKLPHVRVEVEVIQTEGDRIVDRPLAAIGGAGLFIKELESALIDGRIDVAVHSMKDLESTIPAGLALAATTERSDPRDALVSREATSLDALPRNGTVGTGSLRRRSQLLAARPDLTVVDLRGNVPTRLEKFDRSSWDAVILAGAGLSRLELESRIRAYIPTSVLIPAVGQGALALETRDDDELKRQLGFLNHPETERAVRAERAFLARLAGGCRVPIGGYAELDADGALALSGYVGSPDGTTHLRRRVEGSGDAPEELGQELAEAMLREGAGEIIAGIPESA